MTSNISILKSILQDISITEDTRSAAVELAKNLFREDPEEEIRFLFNREREDGSKVYEVHRSSLKPALAGIINDCPPGYYSQEYPGYDFGQLNIHFFDDGTAIFIKYNTCE